jgi:hypothetical protein
VWGRSALLPAEAIPPADSSVKPEAAEDDPSKDEDAGIAAKTDDRTRSGVESDEGSWNIEVVWEYSNGRRDGR